VNRGRWLVLHTELAAEDDDTHAVPLPEGTRGLSIGVLAQETANRHWPAGTLVYWHTATGTENEARDSAREEGSFQAYGAVTTGN
jgi:hypothetical protein